MKLRNGAKPHNGNGCKYEEISPGKRGSDARELMCQVIGQAARDLKGAAFERWDGCLYEGKGVKRSNGAEIRGAINGSGAIITCSASCGKRGEFGKCIAEQAMPIPEELEIMINAEVKRLIRGKKS